MERVDDDVKKRHLLSVGALDGPAHHSTDCEVRTDALLLAVLFDIVDGIHSRGDEVSRLVVVELLHGLTLADMDHPLHGNCTEARFLDPRVPSHTHTSS